MYDYTVDLFTWPVIMRKHETSAIGNIPLKRSKNKGASRYDDEITSANGKEYGDQKNKGCEHDTY